MGNVWPSPRRKINGNRREAGSTEPFVPRDRRYVTNRQLFHGEIAPNGHGCATTALLSYPFTRNVERAGLHNLRLIVFLPPIARFLKKKKEKRFASPLPQLARNFILSQLIYEDCTIKEDCIDKGCTRVNVFFIIREISRLRKYNIDKTRQRVV